MQSPDGELALRSLFDIADRMRRIDSGDREVLQRCAQATVDAGSLAQVEVDEVWRHLAIHAGLIKPTMIGRFRVCPECEAMLDIPAHQPRGEA